MLLRQIGQTLDDVNALQQLVDAGRSQEFLTVLDCDKAIFHRVSQLHHGIQIDNSRGAFDRVCGPHQPLGMRQVSGIGFDRQQPVAQRLPIGFRLGLEEVEHRESGKIAAHDNATLKPERTCGTSSNVATSSPPRGSKFAVNRYLACWTVTGGCL